MLSQTFMRCMCSNSSASHSIGFVGLCNMGTHMSTHLLQKGHQLHVFDISEQACEVMKAKGATTYSSSRHLARNMDFVITMLPDSEAVSSIYLDMTHLGVSKETIFIDTSTIEPNLAQTLKKLIEVKGGHFVDAPATGGILGAEQATLTFMVGSKPKEFDAIRSILECMGKHVLYCGECGMGQAAKLCNNLLLGISTLGLAEALNLALHLGMDAQTFLNAVNTSTGRCWISEECNLIPGKAASESVNGSCNGMSMTTNLMAKHLGMVAHVAAKSNAPLELGAFAHKMFEQLDKQGLGQQNFSFIFDFLRKKHGKVVKK